MNISADNFKECSELRIEKKCFKFNEETPDLQKGKPVLSVQTHELPEKVTDCNTGVGHATGCCGDPTTCLGESALSTFKNVNTFFTMMGPGMANLAQAMGKDVYGMCQAMQTMAGTGAGLSMAASGKCSGAISTCENACETDIATQCDQYCIAKQTCTKAKTANPPNNSEAAQTTFESDISGILTAIKGLETQKASCIAQKSKNDVLLNDMSQMANTAMSAELCKLHSKNNREIENCRKKKEQGYKWQNGECEPPEKKEGDDDKDTKKLAALNTTGTAAPGGEGGGKIGPFSPESPEQPKQDDDDEEDGSASSSGTGGMGGGGKTGGGAGASDDEDGISLAESSSESAEASDNNTGAQKTNANSSGSRRMRGFGGRGFGRGGYSRRGGRGYGGQEDEDPAIAGLGGGGFSGYGGGGSGFDEEESSQRAGLGLSKKKIEELKKKEGAKRGTASKTGGSHQSVFERVSKRFQSLCRNKLDCR